MEVSSPVMFALLVVIGAASKHVNDDLLKSVNLDPISRVRLAKRALFNNRVSTLEIVFAFVVNVHVFLASDTIRTDELCECRSRFDRERFVGDLFPCLIVGVLILSICRCLLQIVALSELCRSDTASMTRVYLAPFTCVVSALCISSWFSVFGIYNNNNSYPPIDYRCDLLGWLRITAGGNRCVLCYALAWIFTLAVSDSVEFYRHEVSVTHTRRTEEVVASSFRREEVSFFVATLKNDIATEETVVKNLERQEALSDATTTTNVHNPDTFNVASADKATSPLLPTGTVSPKPTGRPCLSVSVFLRQSVWFHVSLLMYFVIVMGAYEYVECSFAYVAFGFHRAAVFSALLAANAVWRLLQILAFGHFFRRTLRSYIYTDL